MKVIRFLFWVYLILIHVSLYALPSDCKIDPNDSRDASQFLTDCARSTTGIDPSQYSADMEGTKDMIIKIANGAISFWALLAVGALVWSGIQYTKAYGEDEKLKKAKTTGIYSLIGLILLLTAFWLVDIFINFIYTVTGN